MERIKTFFHGIKEMLSNPVVSILPGHLSFAFVLSFIPLLSLIGLIAYDLSISIDILRVFLSNVFPGQTGEILLQFLNRETIYFNGALFTLLAISISSNGMYSLIRVSNILYGDNRDNISLKIKNRIKSLLMAFLMIGLVIFMFIVLGWGNSIIYELSKIEALSQIYSGIEYVYRLIKFPLSFFVIYFIIKIVYTLAPNENIKSKTVNWGSLFTTISLIIVTVIYAYYVTISNRYDILYGSLSNIIILFIWLYFISLVFILGLVINVYNSKKLEENKKEL